MPSGIRRRSSASRAERGEGVAESPGSVDPLRRPTAREGDDLRIAKAALQFVRQNLLGAGAGRSGAAEYDAAAASIIGLLK